jgi:hypothetical protein
MKKTFIYNAEVKRSAFAVMMLEAMGFKLVDSTEGGFDGLDGECDEEQRPPKYVRLAFQREKTENSLLFR